ncbi:hypothetical protein OIDMADRAFT_29860 [Oidiodendron maius Zn]|uniref:Uncharacterized protein n=1 Tax=Oidiodendron maius (strain Zn) TaxID=913774 RepID=A0A0C3HC73_OIDMZ|nr:hypothetical protein OIDMADRAFT_29860 [Oidiodendron maius Zn]
MSDAAYAAIQGAPSPAIQAVLDSLFDPTVNAGLGMKYVCFGAMHCFDIIVTDNMDLAFNDIVWLLRKSPLLISSHGQRHQPPATYDEGISLTFEHDRAIFNTLVVGDDRRYQIQTCPAPPSFAIPAQYKCLLQPLHLRRLMRCRYLTQFCFTKWANCRRLSLTATAGGQGNSKGPEPFGLELNADTFALFGSIAWQLVNGRITGMNADSSFTTA